MATQILILGIGSPFGDDRLGWAAAEMLQRSVALNALEPGRVTISALDRPGAMLLAHWRETGKVIVLDAVRSGALPGTRHRIDIDAAPLAVPVHPASSHGFGVASALALARVLGNLPPRLFLRGIEMDPDWSGPGVSPAAARALPVFAGEVEELVLALAGRVAPRPVRTARF